MKQKIGMTQGGLEWPGFPEAECLPDAPANAPSVDDAEWFDYQMAREYAFAQRGALETVAQQVAPRLCETMRQAGKPLFSAALATGIVQEVRSELRAAWQAGYAQARMEAADSARPASPPVAQAAESQVTPPAKPAQKSRPRAKTAAQPLLPLTPAAPAAVWPDWFDSWQQSPVTFANGRLWLEILGQTGEPLFAHVSAAFAQQRGITQYSGSETRAIQDLVKRQILRRDKAHMGNRTNNLVALTERGREAYRLLFDREPAPQHYPQLLERHVTPERVLLTVLTQAVLEGTGHQVDRYPATVLAGELGAMQPDLVAHRDEQICYIHVKSKADKNDEQAAAEWQRILTATHGQVYIAVPTVKALKHLRAHIQQHTRDFPEVQVRYLVVDRVLDLLEQHGAATPVWQD